MTTPSRNPAAARGMTLVELMLAATLLSAILAAAGGLIISLARGQALWGRAAGPAEQLEQVLNRMEQDLEAAQPFFGIPANGTPTEYEFARVGRPAGGRSAEAWLRVRLRFEAAPSGGTALVREESVWGADAEPPVRETLMLVERGAFAYAKRNAEGQLVWEGTWDGATDGVPRLVRVTPGVVLGAAQEPLALARVMRQPAGALPDAEPAP